MVEIHNYVNDYYGYADSIVTNTDWSMDYVNWISTYNDYAQQIKSNVRSHWTDHKAIGNIPFDYNVATEIDNADNPGSKRYWKNIIPQDYSLIDREGINLNLQPNGDFYDRNLSGWKFGLQGLEPNDSTIKKQVQQQQGINHLNINWNVLNTANLQEQGSTFTMQSDYDNGIYWETPGTYIYSAEVKINRDDVPFYINASNIPNDRDAIQWSSQGLETGIWHNVYLETDLINPYSFQSYTLPLDSDYAVLGANYVNHSQIGGIESTEVGNPFNPNGTAMKIQDTSSTTDTNDMRFGYRFFVHDFEETHEFSGLTNSGITQNQLSTPTLQAGETYTFSTWIYLPSFEHLETNRIRVSHRQVCERNQELNNDSGNDWATTADPTTHQYCCTPEMYSTGTCDMMTDGQANALSCYAGCVKKTDGVSTGETIRGFSEPSVVYLDSEDGSHLDTWTRISHTFTVKEPPTYGTIVSIRFDTDLGDYQEDPLPYTDYLYTYGAQLDYGTEVRPYGAFQDEFNVPMKGIFELKTDEVFYDDYQNAFELDFDIRNIQIDFVESGDEGIEKYFDEYGDNVISIDANSPQRWKSYINEYSYNEETDEIVDEVVTTPYYPVLPRFNVFGKFTDELPYSNKDDNWYLQYSPIDDSDIDENEESSIDLVPKQITELDGTLHTPFGSPDRLWNQDDVNAPITNEDFSNNAYRYHNYLLVDVNLSEVNDNKTEDKSGMANEGIVNQDYKIKFEKDTRKPTKPVSKSSIKTDNKDNPY